MEQLPETSLIIVFYNGRETLLHTDTHFYPYGHKFIQEPISENIPKWKTDTLKKILSEGYTAYAYKINMFTNDAKYFKFLETDYGIILKDYSKTFCKMVLVSETEENADNYSSDPICFEDIEEKREKIWPVTLKWSP